VRPASHGRAADRPAAQGRAGDRPAARGRAIDDRARDARDRARDVRDRARDARDRARDAREAALEAAEEPRDQGPVELRLAIGKDGLGIELAHAAAFACVDVVELAVRLSQVRFPFDVSGGVAKFRHKRGDLDRIGLELDSRRVARWAEPLLRGLLTPGPCSVRLEPRPFGATVSVHARPSVSKAAPHAHLPALAFELALAPSRGDDAVVVVHGARGAHLLEPATTLALRATAALLGDGARREGARFELGDLAGRLVRALLPEAGVRAPNASGVRLAASGADDGVLFLAFARGATLPKIPEEPTLASEVALLTREGDDARYQGALDRARELDLAALERAPRHPEIVRRMVEVDRAIGGRAEAAIAALRDAAPLHGGLLPGELLLESGDVTGAVAALLRAGEREPSSVVAALAYARAAELASDPHDALEWLDAAVARAPRLAELRWERAQRRLSAGRLPAARADFQELEALAHGARDRHDVLRRAGDAYRTAGLGVDAALLYERALL